MRRGEFLKRLQIGSRGRAVVLGGLALHFLIALAVAPGCGGSGGPPPDGRLAIEGVAKWRILYLTEHNRQPPADEKALLDFVEAKLKERGEPFDRAALLISPRDQKPFVVRYGKESANLSTNAVVAHEQEGYDGKVLVAFEIGRSFEVDKSELPSLMAVK
jgi:hypothetical protein